MGDRDHGPDAQRAGNTWNSATAPRLRPSPRSPHFWPNPTSASGASGACNAPVRVAEKPPTENLITRARRGFTIMRLRREEDPLTTDRRAGRDGCRRAANPPPGVFRQGDKPRTPAVPVPEACLASAEAEPPESAVELARSIARDTLLRRRVLTNADRRTQVCRWTSHRRPPLNRRMMHALRCRAS